MTGAFRQLQALYQHSRVSGVVSRLIGGITVAVSGTLLYNILGAVAQILVVRMLGATLYGQYATITATLSILISLMGIGLDTWLLYEGSRHPDTLAATIWHVLLAKSVAAVIMLVLLAIAWSNHVVETLVVVLGVIGIIFDSFAATGYSALRAMKRNSQIALFQTLTPLALIIGLLGTGGVAANLVLLFAIQCICSAGITIVLMARIRHVCGPLAGWTFNWRYLLSGAWLFVAADLLANIYGQAGIVMLGNTIGTAAVGMFRPALNLISYSYLVPGMMFAVGLPLLNAPHLSRQEYLSLVRVLAYGAITYGVGVFGVLQFGGDWLLIGLYGAQYQAALPFLHTMSLIPLFKACSFVCAAVLLSYHQQRLRVIVQVIVVVVALTGNLLLIPGSGGSGAAWVYLLIEVLILALYGGASIWVMRNIWQ